MLSYIFWCLILSVVGAAFILYKLGDFLSIYELLEEQEIIVGAGNLMGICVVVGAFFGAYWGVNAVPEIFVRVVGMIATWVIMVFLIIFACCKVEDLLYWLAKKNAHE